MAILTLRKAADAAGISRQTIYRYAKQGRLSTVQLDDGTLAVDTAELLRVFGTLRRAVTDSETVARDSERQYEDSLRQPHDAVTVAALQAEVDILGRQLEAAQERETRLLGIIEQQTRLLTHQTVPEASRGRNWMPWILMALLTAILAYVVVMQFQLVESEPDTKPTPQEQSAPRHYWEPEGTT